MGRRAPENPVIWLSFLGIIALVAGVLLDELVLEILGAIMIIGAVLSMLIWASRH